jgi:hypothetical protein
MRMMRRRWCKDGTRGPDEAEAEQYHQSTRCALMDMWHESYTRLWPGVVACSAVVASQNGKVDTNQYRKIILQAS